MGAGIIATFNDDGNYVIAIVLDEVILEFTEEEVEELGLIR